MSSSENQLWYILDQIWVSAECLADMSSFVSLTKKSLNMQDTIDLSAPYSVQVSKSCIIWRKPQRIIA